MGTKESWTSGKVALVTGAARGLGTGFAEALAGAGARVAICDVLAEVHDVAADLALRHGVEVKAWTADMADPAAIWRFVDEAHEAFGGIDVLVNNAGIWAPTKPDDPLHESLDTLQRILDVNTRGAFLMGRAVMAKMLEHGGGHIVNICTDHVYTEPQRPTGGGPGMDVYDASKWAMNAMTLAWARALDGRIRVNALCMGATDSFMLRTSAGGDPAQELIDTWKRPEDVAALMIELLDQGPQGRTGWNLPVWVRDPIVMPEEPGDWAVRVGTMKAIG